MPFTFSDPFALILLLIVSGCVIFESVRLLNVTAPVILCAPVPLKMNVPENRLAEVIGFLPAEKSPTVSRLADSAWVAVEVILEERQERELIPALKRAGATGIITYPLNKVIP